MSRVLINVAKKGQSVMSELTGQISVKSRLFVPNVSCNLLSMAHILLSGYHIEAEGEEPIILTPETCEIVAI